MVVIKKKVKVNDFRSKGWSSTEDTLTEVGWEMTGFTSFYRKVLPIKEIIIMICLFLFCDPFQRILSAESRRKPTRTLPRPTCSNTGKSNDGKLLKQSSKTIISQIETLMTNWPMSYLRKRFLHLLENPYWLRGDLAHFVFVFESPYWEGEN